MKSGQSERRTILAVFAHPDDEAFGPGGTIAKLAERHEVHILCATKGQAGKDRGARARRDLSLHRSEELRRSATILGVRSVSFLGFLDGELSNNQYHRLADAIFRHARHRKPDALLTFEPQGVSGHIDHIAVSMATSYCFDRLPKAELLLQYCLHEKRARASKDYFIYFPDGYVRRSIDCTVNTEDVWQQKLRAMREHKSQIHDLKRILRFAARFPREENFLIRIPGANQKTSRERRRLLRRVLGL